MQAYAAQTSCGLVRRPHGGSRNVREVRIYRIWVAPARRRTDHERSSLAIIQPTLQEFEDPLALAKHEWKKMAGSRKLFSMEATLVAVGSMSRLSQKAIVLICSERIADLEI